ncbi:peptidoglycan/LPS O-acetylase OafA/YrhL [Solirubrobacter pauli]|uniref:Peptidoglycan/LPS O-acetylase OafA/YrhL n=1 Tax=Solirubrobacter pauli TaxID=166793 RepID=A0A660LHA2_9ACTN|nr:acyltransferase [Solirubrobacter pauli]RKQ94109.1 peptidoglycan/LPS O-acetylase OafA/YrhL [Solirubrobacter pauli]
MTAVAEPEAATAEVVPDARQRTHWLDGVRGAAALFVVLHHMWLGSWPFFPEDRGPVWLGWLLYGHLAVAVFIVVSGYSLALAPLRHGGELVGGLRRFIRRRAWRILPAYWAALVLSMLLFVTLIEPSTGAGTATKSFVVHGLLLQDVIGNVAPNGTFWSIAIEWQIYFLFPVMLLLALRFGMVRVVLLTAGIVLVAHLLAGTDTVLSKINNVSPQFLLLFALGVLAAWTAHGRAPRPPRWALAGVAGASAAGLVTLAVAQGSPWMVGHWFWVDVIAGTGFAALLLLLSDSRSPVRDRTLGSRPAVFLGSFSYSLYLIHGPLLALAEEHVVEPLDLSPLAHFAVLLVLVLPVVLVACYAFFRLFERPFLTRRDFASLRTLPAWTLVAGRGRKRAAAGEELPVYR